LLISLVLATGAADAAELPARIVARGSVIAAIVPNYPPLELRDPASGKLTGFDVELGEALAQRLAIRIEWQETSFEQMVSALRTGRVDLILSGMTDLPSRHDTVNFVDYLASGPQFFVQASRAAEFPDALALCGKSVGASRRTSFPAQIEAWSTANCQPAGKAAVRVIGTEGSADARTQLKQGRIDAAVQGNETLPFVMAQEPGAYAPVGPQFGRQLTGIGIGKDDAQLQKAVAGALAALIADGTYQRLLDSWSLSANKIDKVTVNAGE
jgi:polar amino acid transport system substrate-binding protein